MPQRQNAEKFQLERNKIKNVSGLLKTTLLYISVIIKIYNKFKNKIIVIMEKVNGFLKPISFINL